MGTGDGGAATSDAGPTIAFDAGTVTPGEDAGPPSVGPGDMCGDVRTTGLIYNGTPEPTALPLTPGQVIAMVSFGGCSGAFIADEWVLTADHCSVRPGRELCVGTEASNPNVCFRAAEVFDHPDGYDISLVRVNTPASERMPELQPVPVMTEVIDDSWIGTIGEASGYGRQEDGSSGEREFSAEPIHSFERDQRNGGQLVAIDGMGERGVCFGDSGGPLMVLAPDSSARVLGVLSFGDPSCLDIDRYTRADVLTDWIESHTGPTIVDGAPCGRITEMGECSRGTAFWCEDDMLSTERCADGSFCGWDTSVEGYRCMTGADPCEGVTNEGECRGEVAVWCDRGVLRQRDCGACGETCFNDEEIGGFYCGADPCSGLDYLGECRGDTAVWCDDGEINMRDCSARGLRCDYVNDRIGNFCTR